jgi:hypothetical protein
MLKSLSCLFTIRRSCSGCIIRFDKGAKSSCAPKFFLLLAPSPGGKSRFYIERRKVTSSSQSFALDLLASGCVVFFERTMRKCRSGGRFFQESWPINFESFPASAYTQSRQENAAFQTRRFSRIKCCAANADSTRGAATACPKREASSRSASGFSRASGKRGYALWNSGPRPERPSHQSLFTRGKLH